VDEQTINYALPSCKGFQIQQIKNAFGDLQANAQKLLGRKLVLELIDGDHEAREKHREKIREKVAPTEQEELHKACKENKPLQELVEILDAEIIPEAEREDWLRKPDETS
jgi:hypothetical protein